MEVKPLRQGSVQTGYKQTEVGVIPEKWDVSTIGEQSQIFGRIGFRGYTVGDIVDEGCGAIAINPSNIQGGKTVFDKCTYITWRKYEESPEIKIDDGDIILVKTGSTFGKTAMVKNLPIRATLNPQVVVFKNVKGSQGFFGYMMGFPIIQNQIGAAVVGGALPTLSQRLIAAFKFPLPPLPEQHAIATALSDVDALLDALNRDITKKRDLKQAAMQQLLTGQTRLPTFHGEWEVKRLGDILTVRHGKSQRGITAPDGKYPILASGGEIGRTNAYTYDKPSVLIGRKGTIDSPQYVDSPFWTVDTLFFTEISSEADAKFVFYKFTMIRWRSYNEASGVPSLNARTIENIEIQSPPLPEQIAIAAVLTDMDAELALLTQRLAKTRALKQGMMQELLTGRTRLI